MFDPMKLRHLAFEGPDIDDFRTLRSLPGPLRDILRTLNGFIAFDGGFHVRGACRTPSWHSLAVVTTGDLALHKLFGPVRKSDIPFAEDALGDQYIIRDLEVYRLHAETAQIEGLDKDLNTFFEHLQDDPFDLLDVQPLQLFIQEGGRLQPGQLLQADPPFCLREPHQTTRLSAVPTADRLRKLSDLGRQMTLVPDAGLFELLGQS